MSKYLMLDLFSGLGGASQAMVDHPAWNVIRIDNNPLLLDHVPDMTLMSIEEVHGNLSVYAGLDIDLLWASPPCVNFSDACDAPMSKFKRENPTAEYKPDLTLVQKTLEIIEALKPKAWIIENVRGSRPYFTPLMGGPKVIIGPYYLYGNFPLFNAQLAAGYHKYKNDKTSSDPLRANYRAFVPREVSEALRQTIQYQTKLDISMLKSKQSPIQRGPNQLRS